MNSSYKDCKCKLKRIVAAGIICLMGTVKILAAEATSVCFDTICFYPETARTSAEKQRGLMGREKLTENGMLFVYEKEGQPAFWMKNMQIPLDFLWLDHSGKAVDIHENVPPCTNTTCPTLKSSRPSQYVLELPVGSIQKSKIKIGDQAILSGLQNEK